MPQSKIYLLSIKINTLFYSAYLFLLETYSFPLYYLIQPNKSVCLYSRLTSFLIEYWKCPKWIIGQNIREMIRISIKGQYFSCWVYRFIDFKWICDWINFIMFLLSIRQSMTFELLYCWNVKFLCQYLLCKMKTTLIQEEQLPYYWNFRSKLFIQSVNFHLYHNFSTISQNL